MAKPGTEPVSSEALKTWVDLNHVIRNASEHTCASLLMIEKAGRKRTRFLLRIHSRLNKVRADREREELLNIAIDRSRG